jgi:hypothetical protein
MVVISSAMTRFYKYVFPVMWFGFLAIFFVTGWIAGDSQQSPVFLLMPCAMALFGYFLFKKTLWVLADEVRDYGTYLVVRNRGEEATINLSNIMNVSVTTNVNPPRVTLRLVEPSRFGDELAFSPARTGFSLNPFKKNPIVEDLIVRVDQARLSRAR